jgi:hypothetical protein
MLDANFQTSSSAKRRMAQGTRRRDATSDDRKQMTEVRGQMAEDRRQKSENR